jgi:hypothetical protein
MNRARILTTSALLVLASTVVHAQGDRGRGRGRGNDDKDKRNVPQQEQQRRIEDQRRRDAAYQEALNNQVRAAQQAAAALQQQKRTQQYALHEQYLENLRQQQERLRAQRDVQRDPYYSTPMTYRYRISGSDRQTNQYGADLLRQAVNDGYQQGWKSGRADRADHWASNYQKSYAYQDANYGYSGNYVPQSDYNYYFRQGFRRGYDDGYASRTQYGTVVNGSPSILGTILSGILGLATIR